MSDSSNRWDVLIIGSGIAGFSAAVTLAERGKSVAIVSRATGATSVSSGCWDFGPIPSSLPSFSTAATSARWKDVFTCIAGEIELPLSGKEWMAAIDAVAAILEPDLAIDRHWTDPVVVPSTSGHLRRAYVLQSIHSGASLRRKGTSRVGVVSSRRWRFRGDLLSRAWNDAAIKQGLKAEFRAIDLSWESDGWDIPLSRVCADLEANPEGIDRLRAALGRLSDSVDILLLPPVLPSSEAFASLSKEASIPLAEAVPSEEPVSGYRLWKAMQATLTRLKIPVIAARDLKAQSAGGRIRELSALGTDGRRWETLQATHFVLATGRFFGGGLQASASKMEEPLFALPLYQERGGDRVLETRTADWRRVGLSVDKDYRPLAEDGRAAFQNLTACGSILGGVAFSENQVGIGFFAATGRACVASIA